MLRFFSIGLIFALALFAYTDANAWEEWIVGRSVNVACQSLSVHERPSGSTRKLNQLKFGNRVKVASLENEFELSQTDFSSKAQLEASRGRDDPPISKDSYMRYSWVGIESGGYVAVSCLMPDYLFEGASEQQLLTAEKEKVEQLKVSSAKKNFSEDEEGDAVAMKGLAGSVAMGKPKYQFIDQYIESSQGLVSHEDIQEFKASGGLQ